MLFIIAVWAFSVWFTVSWMKMATDWKQMDHYFYRWQRESDEDLEATFASPTLDDDELRAYRSRQEVRDTSFFAHRKAIWGF